MTTYIYVVTITNEPYYFKERQAAYDFLLTQIVQSINPITVNIQRVEVK